MQKLQLSIPEPCHENWQNMTATQQGRFCNACAKEVIDFSMMTDREVLNYFTALTHEKVCGRALPSQLERTIAMPKEPKKKLFWYWNYIVMFFMFFGKANNTKAQGRIQTGCAQAITPEQLNVTRSTNVNYALAGKVGKVRVQTQRAVKGKVVDRDKAAVPFATVKIKHIGNGLAADANGEFSIEIKQGDTLLISAAGFKEIEVLSGTASHIYAVLERREVNVEVVVTAGMMIKRTDFKNRSTLPLLNRNVVSDVGNEKTLDTVIVSAIYDTRHVSTMMGAVSISGIKIEKQHEIITPVVENTDAFTIYPNPVQRGNAINLNLNFKQTGLHQIQITDANGRAVFYKHINAVGKNQLEQIICDSKWAAGIYFVSLFDDKNKLVNKSSFIIQ